MHPILTGLKLDGFQLVKLLSHNAALYQQTLEQLTPKEVASRVVSARNPFSNGDVWQQWTSVAGVAAADYKKTRARQSQRLSIWKSITGAAQAKGSPRKRTAFTLVKKPKS